MTDGDGAGDELPEQSGSRRPPAGSASRTAGLSRLLPDGPGRRRRMAEAGAVAGVAAVVLAFVGATVALRPASAPTRAPSGPGLPVPVEEGAPGSGSATPAATTSPTAVPGYPGRTPSSSYPAYTGVPAPGATGTPTSPAPSTTRASAPVPTATRTTRPTPTVSVSVSPSPSSSAPSSSAPPTDPTDPVPPDPPIPPVPPKPKP